MATHQPAVSSFLVRLGFDFGFTFVFVGFPLGVVDVVFRLVGLATEARTEDRLGVDLVGFDTLLEAWSPGCVAAARFAARSSLIRRFFRL